MFDDHHVDIIKMKTEIETMWMTCGSKRERRSMASREVPGYSFFGDNIGIIKRRDKGMASIKQVQHMVSIEPAIN